MFVFQLKQLFFKKICVWNLDGNTKNAGNQGGDAENQRENLVIAVQVT